MSISSEHKGNTMRALIVAAALALPGARARAENPTHFVAGHMLEAPPNHTPLIIAPEHDIQSDWETIPAPVEGIDFAGRHSRIYSNESFPEVDSNGITTVVPASNGELLVGRTNGVDRVQIDTHGVLTHRKSFTIPENFTGDVMIHVGEAPNGRVYMGGPNGFLELSPKGEFTRIADRRDINGNIKFGLYEQGAVMSDQYAFLYSEAGETVRWISPKSHPLAPQDEILTMTTHNIDGRSRCLAIVREYTGSTDPRSRYDPSKRVDSLYEFSPRVKPGHQLDQKRLALLSNESKGFNAGNISQTRISPDGGYMVFSQTGDGGIFKLNLSTGQISRITIPYVDDRINETTQATVRHFDFDDAGRLWSGADEVQGLFRTRHPLTEDPTTTQMTQQEIKGGLANTYIKSVNVLPAGVFVGQPDIGKQPDALNGVLTQFTSDKPENTSLYMPIAVR